MSYNSHSTLSSLAQNHSTHRIQAPLTYLFSKFSQLPNFRTIPLATSEYCEQRGYSCLTCPRRITLDLITNIYVDEYDGGEIERVTALTKLTWLTLEVVGRKKC